MTRVGASFFSVPNEPLALVLPEFDRAFRFADMPMMTSRAWILRLKSAPFHSQISDLEKRYPHSAGFCAMISPIGLR